MLWARLLGLTLAMLLQSSGAIATSPEPSPPGQQPEGAIEATSADTDVLFQTWTAQELASHPLVGRIWNARQGKLVSRKIYNASLLTTDFVLLGEVHDNPDHHRIQAHAMKVVASARRPAVVMEMLSMDQSDVMDAFYELPAAEEPDNPVKDFFDKVGWDQSGWPPRDIYAPIIKAALGARLRIYPGSDKRKSERAIGKAGLGEMSTSRLRKLALNEPLSEARAKALASELKSSHCGLVADNTVVAMASVQRYRDGFMAATLARKGKNDGAILIAGNGHVRKDRGVPWYLDRLAADKSVLVVMATEVRDGITDPATYAPRSPEGEAAADFLIFTPRATRSDPCDQLRQQLQQKP